METKICITCGRLAQDYVNIFKTEGLKNKIETCLPIVVSPHILLPDTICVTCLENVESFFNFIKHCLQNIIILEAQYDVHESCLKTKRKFEKSCSVSLSPCKEDKNTQADYLDILKVTSESNDLNWLPKYARCPPNGLVDYDVESDASDNDESGGKVILTSKTLVLNDINNYIDKLLTSKNCLPKRHYFDDVENNLISEIEQRRCLKRKLDVIETRPTKIFKMDSSSRRKSKQPKKLDFKTSELKKDASISNGVLDEEEILGQESEIPLVTDAKDQTKDVEILLHLPQVCLLCESRFSGAAALAAHVFDTHGIDMAEVVGQQTNGVSEAVALNNDCEKKKKIPNLVKISDLKKDVTEDNLSADQPPEEPPTLVPSFVCPMCPAVLTSRSDLFVHLRAKHRESTSLMCGMCLQQTSTSLNLRSHVEMCAQNHQFGAAYTCQLCFYGDDDYALMEAHVPVHHFLAEICGKQSVEFEAARYIRTGAGRPNMLFCEYCRTDDFPGFREFSTHRRLAHSIFHCDLCTKLYGRNSHLWKHVNRLHKGHSSITCQLCFKTSASEYHLQQHFNKIHSPKNYKQKVNDQVISSTEGEDFMSQKFRAFDFQSVKQSFMRQELMEQQKIFQDSTKQSSPVAEEPHNCESDSNSHNTEREDDDEDAAKKGEEILDAPKEIDSSSNLYTNIITNYTPPVNIGDYKCPKCGKNFQKKPMLKKHKKNCRPRLQKDLLTRCKSCARVFKDRQSLTKHLDNYHSEYACEICGVRVQSKCEIVSHIRFSHPGSHLTCKLCGNILRSGEDLARHVQNHAESFICQFCADPIPSKIKLKMHVLSLHRKILSLSCGICLKLFETQHILRDHVRLVHRDALSPMTSCTVCGKNYGSKWKTFDHLNKSHGKIFKACRVCLEVFNDDAELQAHGEVAHTGSVCKQLGPVSERNSAPSRSKTDKSANNEAEDPRNNDNDHATAEDDYENESEEEEEEQEYESHDDYPAEEEQPPKYVLTNDLKMSLLEKRLAGKKITEEDTKPAKKAPPPSPSKSKKERKSTTEEGDATTANNPQHNSSKRTVYVNSNDPSHCEICFKNWPAKKHLWQHYIRCHKAVAATVCGICLKTNDGYAALQVHLRENHPTLLHGQGFGSNFICRICGRYHNASSKLRLHMAIHENFDWAILAAEEEDGGGKKAEVKAGPKREVNGYGEAYDYNKLLHEEEDLEDGVKYENDIESINYEDDIEQVELSENEETDADRHFIKTESSSDEDEDDDDDEEGTDNDETSESSMKRQMLQNMLAESQRMGRQVREDSASSDSNMTNYTDDGKVKSEEDSEDSQDSSYSRANSEAADSTTGNVFRCKPEELDSAIKSISYDCMEQADEATMDDYDIQDQALNEHELASAVGSIL